MRYLIILAIIQLLAGQGFGQPKKSAKQSNEELRIKLGNAMLLGKIDSAIYWGRHLVESYPTVENLLLFASLYEIKGDTAAANRHYNHALEVPDTARYQVYRVMAQTYVARGKNDRAIFYARQSLQSKPDQPATHFLLANLYRDRGQGEEAVIHLRQAYQLDSTNREYIQQIYVLEYSAGNKREAVRLMEKLTQPGQFRKAGKRTEERIDSAELVRLFALASGYLEVDRFEEANALLLSIQDLHLFGDSTYVLLGESYKGLGMLDKAAAAYQSAIQLNTKPDQGQYEELARLYELLGEPQQAVKTLLDGAQKEIPELKEWAADYREAIEEIKRVTPLLETATGAEKLRLLFLLAKLYHFTRHQDFALQILTDMQDLGGATDSVTYLLAIVHHQRGQYNLSEKLSNQLLVKDPKVAEYHLLLLASLFGQRSYSAFLTAVPRAQQAGVDINAPEVQAMILKAYAVIGDGDMQKALRYRFQ
jgi:tetratricopeptide (TPR) repeat protein